MKLNFKNLKHSDGFTLAEVLITLVIIGIIAAITVPVVMQNSNESATVSKVKKGLSILGQAKILAEAQNGPITDWDYEATANYANAQKFWSYLRPYISVAQDCGSSTNCYQTDGIYVLAGSLHNPNHATNAAYYKFVLSDGSVMWLRIVAGDKCAVRDSGVDNACAAFYIDVNGDKKPNTVGRDIFQYVMSSEGVFPHLGDDCRKTLAGFSCSSYIIKNNNMNYLH